MGDRTRATEIDTTEIDRRFAYISIAETSTTETENHLYKSRADKIGSIAGEQNNIVAS